MPLISRDDYFEQWYPTSWARQAQEFPGQTAANIAQNKQIAKTYPVYGFENAWNIFNQQQIATEAANKQAAEVAQEKTKAEEAARVLKEEQDRLTRELEFERARIIEQQRQEQSQIQAQISRERAAAEQEQAALRVQFEQERTATEKSIAEAAAQTAQQQLITKKAVAASQAAVGQAASTEKAKLIQAATTQANTPAAVTQQRRKTSIGQPGIAITRVSARSGVGGYGGTAPTRVNPTGLNI